MGSWDSCPINDSSFADLRTPMAEPALLVRTGDPDWFLVVFPVSGPQGWRIASIHGIRRAVLDTFPAASFISWPLDQQPPKAPARVTQGVG